MEETKETNEMESVTEVTGGVFATGKYDYVKELNEVLAKVEEITNRVIEMRVRIDELGGKVEKRERVEAIIGELRELPKLFSGADALSIDDEGWQSISDGGSVVGAYVRSEHRKKLASEANKAGAMASSGEVAGGVGAVYSVDEIKSMDRSTVRKNLDKVLSSLEAVKG